VNISSCAHLRARKVAATPSPAKREPKEANSPSPAKAVKSSPPRSSRPAVTKSASKFLQENADGVSDLSVESVLNLEEARLADLLQHYASIIKAPDGSVDVNRPGDTGGNRAIHAACFENNTAHVMALIALGADINVQNFDGLTALACACTVAAVSCVELLLAAGANVDICDYSGVHPCHRVAASKCFRILPKLLKVSKTGVNAVSSNGRQPLHDAAYHNSVESMIPFLHKGADVNCAVPEGYPQPGCTPAHFAAQQDCCDALKYLWLKKANLDAKNAKGDTPLHFAAAFSRVAAVSLLLEFGVDATLQNAQGATSNSCLFTACSN
jgi:ankyrin repeat protein